MNSKWSDDCTCLFDLVAYASLQETCTQSDGRIDAMRKGIERANWGDMVSGGNNELRRSSRVRKLSRASRADVGRYR